METTAKTPLHATITTPLDQIETPSLPTMLTTIITLALLTTMFLQQEKNSNDTDIDNNSIDDNYCDAYNNGYANRFNTNTVYKDDYNNGLAKDRNNLFVFNNNSDNDDNKYPVVTAMATTKAVTTTR